MQASGVAGFRENTMEDAAKGADFTFVQISDSHIGFNKPANPDVTATLQWRSTRSTRCRKSRISSFIRAT